MPHHGPVPQTAGLTPAPASPGQAQPRGQLLSLEVLRPGPRLGSAPRPPGGGGICVMA